MWNRDKDGKVIDHYTSTVEDAADFERVMNDSDWSDYWDLLDEVEPIDDETAELYAEGYYDDEDDCMCSDPGCPCSGVKKGRL